MHPSRGLCAALLLIAAAPFAQADDIAVRHVGPDTWRVDYRFAQPVSAIRLTSVGDYRSTAWKVLTPGMALSSASGFDVLSSRKPFKTASIEIKTFDGLAPKSYAPFNRFSDGGTAIFLGHLQGETLRAGRMLEMKTTIRLAGLPKENVIAPPPNRLAPGAERGYAYFGPAQAVSSGTATMLIDPDTPPWVRATLLDAAPKLSQYYEKAYQRALKDSLLVMVSIGSQSTPGLDMKGGAVMGQLSYRLGGQQLAGDHPKKREYLTRLVAHEMAHLWQLAVARGGVGEQAPWVHEGGADAMALDALVQAGLANEEAVSAYRAKQTATCDKLGGAVDSYDGIYACGLVRFDRLAVGIVPLWRAMMQATEAKGEVYSPEMIEAVVAGLTSRQAAGQ